MKLKIMIVDDNEQLAELLVATASSLGIDAWAVLDSRQVIDQVRRRRPDAMLLDLDMPAMDGRDVLARLKGDPETADIVILVVTGWSDDFTRDLCLDYGADDFIVKPIESRRLFERVEAIVATRPHGDGPP